MRPSDSAPTRSGAAGAPGLATALAAAALMLAGCSGVPKSEPTITGSVPHDGYRTRHPIVLSESAETLDIPVGSQSGRLTETTAETIAAFGAQSRERGASGVTILVPSGSGNETAASQMSRSVKTALQRGGVPAHAISLAPYKVEQAAADAPIRLAYPRVVAGVPHACGTWPDQVVGQFDNSDYYNFGCAYQANIAAMVVDPSDLVTPKGMPASDATRRTTVISKYRQGAPTKSETALDKKSISNIGN
ncbi:hypothetical protein ABB55_19340 [Prosthecomicrobium hirschii]|uniref:Pilus assembly protein n=1 Tax=Prosthecodimorpha hirschii TaxID=665126 RepID=A0A0P6W6F4_9HYPH|nr:CpaD family pilus assembly protein [Prosthecomicrobium hirschii]KPL54102.1 hypothetical protein ABB55_19340 [Prosthecomicrobium hirschii]